MGDNAMSRGVGGQSPANVQKFLKGQSYPATKGDLVRTARGNKAPKEIMELIKELPEEQFGGPQDVMKGYREEGLHSEADQKSTPSASTSRTKRSDSGSGQRMVASSKEQNGIDDDEEMEEEEDE
jgi:hypothetical protein